ncbi:hypothetical protein [Streptomyces sp. 7-21]|jgi:hypothetical protein|uniref:hypothetical protein n=1 Tax=Streptomyces sp. 7-21 TaxID=2802283 RepID=UPI00192023B0|nr:hypothetical protein [Streptomyces sp. 7-21]MBL1067372.1 hypothetical protein [Streptomyces sp. 7-21]
MTQIVLAVAGLAVLGVLAVRVGLEVRRLARAVAESTERLERAAADLERSAAPLAARAGQMRRAGVQRE